MAAELEEGGCVLEGLVKGVLLPIVRVVRELDGSLDVWDGMLVVELMVVNRFFIVKASISDFQIPNRVGGFCLVCIASSYPTR